KERGCSRKGRSEEVGTGSGKEVEKEGDEWGGGRWWGTEERSGKRRHRDQDVSEERCVGLVFFFF
ncbi:hypothetical protein, partial [Clostridium butyricum]|uniref:hypothetical protein n=1 Tax=Clostridium butyricum TaxID=1492 RepID=UPI0021083973